MAEKPGRDGGSVEIDELVYLVNGTCNLTC